MSLTGPGLRLPGVAPCYVEPEQGGEGTVFAVTGKSMRGTYVFLGIVMLLLTPFPVLMGLPGLHSNSVRLVGSGALMISLGVCCPVAAMYFFQLAARCDLLTVSDPDSTFSSKVWWRWRDRGVSYDELRLVISRGVLRRGPELAVVAVWEGDTPLLVIATDRRKNADAIDSYAARVAELTGLTLVRTDTTLPVAGDVRLTKW